MAVSAWDFDVMAELLNDLGRQGEEVVTAAGLPKDAVATRFTVDMRYVGQGHEITVALPDRDLPRDAFLKELVGNFDRLYRDLFGRTVRAGVEVMTWRLRSGGGKGALNRPQLDGTGEALKGTRPVYVPELGAPAETPVYDHYRLSPGVLIQGPAIVEQRESTVVVGRDATAHLDEHGNLVIDIR
jgi:N-methylhydantoinase A